MNLVSRGFNPTAVITVRSGTHPLPLPQSRRAPGRRPRRGGPGARRRCAVRKARRPHDRAGGHAARAVDDGRRAARPREQGADAGGDLPRGRPRRRADHRDEVTTTPDPFNLLPPTKQTSKSLGSGFVIDSAGHIITNYHVIEGAQKVQVSFSGQDQLPATRRRQGPLDRPRRAQDRRARARAARRCRSATPTASRSATRSSRSATRSASTARSRPASSAPCSARSSRRTASRSTARSRPTPRSTTATRAGR